jgi:ABC-type multidrug transport system fused ATPase/permease subunit
MLMQDQRNRAKKARFTLIHTIARWIVQIAQWIGSILILVFAFALANILLINSQDITSTLVYRIINFFSPPQTGYASIQIFIIVSTFIALLIVILSFILNSALLPYKKLSREERDQQEWEEERRQNMLRTLDMQQVLFIQQKNEHDQSKRLQEEQLFILKELQEERLMFLDQQIKKSTPENYENNIDIQHRETKKLLEETDSYIENTISSPQSATDAKEEDQIEGGLIVYVGESAEENFLLSIDESPLTLTHLTTTLSAIHELAIKSWLISQNRLADLIIYTQTHDLAIAEDAPFTIQRITYNSPFKIEINFTKHIGTALRESIDAFLHSKERLKRAHLDTQEKEEKIKREQMKEDHEQRMRDLKYEDERINLEKKKQMYKREQLIEDIKFAESIIARLDPHVDPNTKTMLIQTLLPDILKLENINLTMISSPIGENGRTSLDKLDIEASKEDSNHHSSPTQH